MDMKILTPTQLFVNGKFLCTVNLVEIKRNDPRFKKSIIPGNPKISPDEAIGTVVNVEIKRRTTAEKEEVDKEKSANDYDEFYNRMVKATDDPNAHITVDTSDL